MTDAPTHKGNYAGELWPPGYHEATHYWLDGKWRELPLSMEQNMSLMASEIEWLRARVKDLTLEGLGLIGRIEQTREALAGTDAASLPHDYPVERMAQDRMAEIERLRAALRDEPTPEQIYNACLSYRHDFGLLSVDERKTVAFAAKEWLSAWQKTLDRAVMEDRTEAKRMERSDND